MDVGQRLSLEQLRPVQQPRKPRGMLGLQLLQLDRQWIGTFRPYASACCLSLRVGAAAGVAVAAADCQTRLLHSGVSGGSCRSSGASASPRTRVKLTLLIRVFTSEEFTLENDLDFRSRVGRS